MGVLMKRERFDIPISRELARKLLSQTYFLRVTDYIDPNSAFSTEIGCVSSEIGKIHFHYADKIQSNPFRSIE